MNEDGITFWKARNLEEKIVVVVVQQSQDKSAFFSLAPF